MTPQEIVAATLRTASGWMGDDGDRIVLIETAANVMNSKDPSWTCPVCDEIICDDGCPLAEVRAALV